MNNTEPKKVPLSGGCHCGATRYVLNLTLPAPHNQSNPPQQGDQKIYRCNCTTCHKLGLFHLKPADPHNDFLLLSPLDPLTQLGDYLTFNRDIHFFFCKTCGVHCLTFCGAGEVVDIDVAAMELPEAARTGSEPTKAWRAIRGDGSLESDAFVTVNGHTIDAGQPAFDMRELTEKKSVYYLNTFSDLGKGSTARWDRPHDQGCY
ncbi:DUF636 domain-containing protein [Trichoderma chlorosporum]